MPGMHHEPREGHVAIGLIVRPWGLRGDVKVESLTDFPDRFEPGNAVLLQGRERVIEASRWQKGALYLKFAGVDSVEQADTLRNELLEIPASDLHELPEGDYYAHELTGMDVRGDGESLGTVRELLHPGPNAVLVVQGDRGEVLVPFIEDVVRGVDRAARVISIDVIPGLLPEPRAPKPVRPPRAKKRPASG